MSEELVTLASIGNGAALELFDRALTEVITNIADANTSGKTKREISIKIVIQPDEQRGIGFASLQVSTKLASVKPVQSTMYFGKKEGKLVAVTNNIQQPSMFDEERSTVEPLRAVSGGSKQ